MAIAPSRTRRLRSTSTVKSTCPGVSKMLIECPRQWQVVAAEVIVIPRSFSWTIHSVVVVLPASMCAMIPMFRSRSSLVLRFTCSTAITAMSVVPPRSVSEMAESLVRFRHPVGLFFAPHRPARVVGGVHQLRGQLLGHALAVPLPGEAHDPPPGQRQAAIGTDLDRHLVGGAAHPPRLDLEHRGGVPQRLLEHLERLSPGHPPRTAQRLIGNALGERFLPVAHDDVDELRHRLRAVDGVGRDRTFDRTVATWHPTCPSRAWRRTWSGPACGSWSRRCPGCPG